MWGAIGHTEHRMCPLPLTSAGSASSAELSALGVGAAYRRRQYKRITAAAEGAPRPNRCYQSPGPRAVPGGLRAPGLGRTWPHSPPSEPPVILSASPGPHFPPLPLLTYPASSTTVLPQTLVSPHLLCTFLELPSPHPSGVCPFPQTSPWQQGLTALFKIATPPQQHFRFPSPAYLFSI